MREDFESKVENECSGDKKDNDKKRYYIIWKSSLFWEEGEVEAVMDLLVVQGEGVGENGQWVEQQQQGKLEMREGFYQFLLKTKIFRSKCTILAKKPDFASQVTENLRDFFFI